MKEFSNKKPYLPPQLTVVEFQVERGYSESDIEVKNPTVDSDVAQNLLGISASDYSNYYSSGLPSGNSGYFSGSGTGDGGGYFGTYF